VQCGQCRREARSCTTSSYSVLSRNIWELYEHALAVLRVNHLAGLFELGPGARGGDPSK